MTVGHETASLIADIIDAADEVRDPLDGVVEKAATDPSSAFVPEVLERLATLRQGDRAAFEALRSKLKTAGCRMAALDEAIAEQTGNTAGPGPKQADILLALAAAAELFHSSDGVAFADVDIDGHRETWPVRSKGFRQWLTWRFFKATQGAPNFDGLRSVLEVIEARARFDSPERPLFVRVGGLDGRLYLDLGDRSWRAIEIDASGWRLVDEPPIRFRRAAGMRPLPLPVPGGSVDTLRSFLNVRSDTDFVLVVAWLLGCLRDRGPYPVIVLSGEQGAAKTTAAELLRALFDPNTAPLRSLPRDNRDLFIASNNSHVLAYDNVSRVPEWLSDTLCRISTGGAFGVRQLHTDQDEVLFEAIRPIILNGIEDIVIRPDLADRALFLNLEPIPENRRRPHAEICESFEAQRPVILGALLDAVVAGLKHLPETHLPTLPRMADFALWAAACERALWPSGTFCSAYCSNRDQAVDSVIDADPIATAVRALLARESKWSGTASKLLATLARIAGERITKSEKWPAAANVLGGHLRRIAPFLRARGITLEFDRTHRARTRTIHIYTVPNHGEDAAAKSSALSARCRNPIFPTASVQPPGGRSFTMRAVALAYLSRPPTPAH